MARHEASGAAAGVDFHLSDEILAVIPTDPYEQLDIARKITSMAISSRVSRLEADVARLHRDLADRDRSEADLRARLADSDARLLAALEDNVKLVKERDTLAMTAKKLSRNLAKLEAFKKQLMQSLSEDNLLLSEAGEDRAVDVENNWSARFPPGKDEVSSSRASSNTSSRSTVTESSQGYQFSITPYVAPNISPGSTPIISSSGGSPLAYSTGPPTPKFYSGPTSPARSRTEGQSTFSSWNGSSHQYSAPVSPPERRSFTGRPRIDGKEFFRQARTRLSYEQFGAFLANIKEFNAQKQSRELPPSLLVSSRPVSMTSQRLGAARRSGGFGFGSRKRQRLAEYPCVSRLRLRRLVDFLFSHEFRQTHRAFMGETAVFMSVTQLQHLAFNGQWTDALDYLSGFLPSDRPLGVHGRALLHFLRVCRAIDDIVTETKESLSVIAAVTVCSRRFATPASPALAKLRAIFSSLIESKTLRDSWDLVRVRYEASSILLHLVYRTPELKDHMRPCRGGSMNPQNVLPLGFGHASFRPRRHIKKQGGQVPASVVAGIYLQKKKTLPSSNSSDHSLGLTHEALVKAKERLVDLIDRSVEAGKPRQRDPVRSACSRGASDPQTSLCTIPRLAGKPRSKILTDIVILREAKEWISYLTEEYLEAWPDASHEYILQYSSKPGASAVRLSKTVPGVLTRHAGSSSISSSDVEAGVGNLSIQ